MSGIRHVLGAGVVKERTPFPLALLIVTSLSRRVARFAALVDRFHAGTLQLPRGVALEAGPFEPASALAERAARAPDPLPRGRGWLVGMVQPVAVYGGFLEQLLTEPETVALLAVSPQAGRLLRPLWRMLNTAPLPEILHPPPAVRRLPRPASSTAGQTVPSSLAVRPAPSRVSCDPPRPQGLRVRVQAFGLDSPIPA